MGNKLTSKQHIRKTVDEARSEAGAFEELGLDMDLVRAIAEQGFTRPTQVQRDAIPAALEGQDLLASAMTGSGKTAAFMLPILQKLRSRPRRVTRALVLTPTRELAAQIVDHIAGLAKYTGVRGAAVYGGMGMGPQIESFKRGVDVIVATPGRLLDHFQYDYAKLEGLEILVLDEADRMLDMGFLPDIRRILQHLPKTPRQTLFFSATMPAPIAELSREMLIKPARINVERKQAPPSAVTQAVYDVPNHLKVDLLTELLRRNEIGNAIVFCRTKHRANRLAEKLERSSISVARIHGNRSQGQRSEALAGFKAGRYRVLVATDIVARGIDVEALDHVVNFDVPNSPADYIHRVGRTARAEATGDAFTFVAPEDNPDIREIERVLGRKIERRRLEGFDYKAAPDGQLEVPLAERIAGIRARKAEERARSRANTEARARRPDAQPAHAAAGAGSARREGPSRSFGGGPARGGDSSRSAGAIRGPRRGSNRSR